MKYFILKNIISDKKGTEAIPDEGRIYAYDQDIGINATIIYSFLTSSKHLK